MVRSCSRGARSSFFACLLASAGFACEGAAPERRAGEEAVDATAAVETAAVETANAEAKGSSEAKVPAVAPGRNLGSGDGFVVWESNRSGAFRIWRQDLGDPSAKPRRISPDEAGRDHCCAKLSPDGRRLVYLSLPGGAQQYRADVGVLHLADADGGRDRVLVEAARHYGEHRAAVWWGIDELVHLDGSGATVRRTLSTGASERLASPGPSGEGWLIAPGGRCATGNTPTFSDFETGRGVGELASLGGCQPSFSADGRRAVWSAGAGGPIDAIDLETRESWTLVSKNDPRLPAGRRYVYFPMLSADSTLLALAGSDGAHDHFRADYDVLLMELDPATLAPAGDAVVVAPHPAVDRFPDPHRGPPGESTRIAGRAPVRKAPAAAADTARERGLVLVWERGDAANRVRGGEPSTLLRAEGAAWLDRGHGMALGGGKFTADRALGDRLVADLTATNQLTLALRLTPAAASQEGTILALSGGRQRRLLLLRQRGRVVELVLRTSDTDREGRTVALAELPPGRPVHLVVSFSPGRLATYVDGVATGAPQPFPGDFFAWRPAPLAFGAEPGQGTTWRGSISHVAFWNRPLDAAEAAREADRVRRAIDGATVARVVVEARVLRTSAAPSLASISPYREALAVDELEIVRQLSGPPLDARKLRRVRWAILDGQTLATPQAGVMTRLVLEPFAAQPQLEPYFVANDLGGAAGELWFDLAGSANP